LKPLVTRLRGAGPLLSVGLLAVLAFTLHKTIRGAGDLAELGLESIMLPTEVRPLILGNRFYPLFEPSQSVHWFFQEIAECSDDGSV
jgi:hypothetical protein